MSQPSPNLKLAVPRHLQDYNGYCGPACAMMVISSESGSSIPAQQALFRDIREHAKQANDRRPIKSPAESLLALLSKNSRARWRKVFDPVPDKVAALLVIAVEEIQRPCLLLVSKGMHWVVAFGITQRDDGSVAGVLMRDPAWAGMPAFYGLSVFPEKSTFTHCAGPCTCLQSDNPPGSVHERYMAMEELVSPRGLQGTPDWEGKGAIAIVPEEARAAAVLPPPSATPPAAPGLTPQAAAMIAVREHGLVGRRDSPPDWHQTLEGGQPGTPILVKDPDDPRDDFYLVPVYAPGASLRTAWIMLDTVTLRMREASLLDHWMVPAFPTDQDVNSIAGEDVTLPDGTRHRFKKSDLRPNHRNLVWKASAASILPYWPVREFTAAHPNTGEPVSIYATQHGKIYAALLPEEAPAAQSPPPAKKPAQNNPEAPCSTPKGSPWKTWLGIGTAAAGIAVAANTFLPGKTPTPPPPGSVQITDITPTSATASWRAVPGATSYNLEYKEQAAGEWLIAAASHGADTSGRAMFASVMPWFAQVSPAGGSPRVSATSTRRELTGLKEGTRYEVRSSASGPGGVSAPSPVTAFETTHSELPAPEGLAAAQVTVTSAQISWQASPKAVSYKLAYRVKGAENWRFADDQIAGTHYTLESLKEATSYEVQAFANGAQNSSGPSVRISFSTVAPAMQAANPSLPPLHENVKTFSGSLDKMETTHAAMAEPSRTLEPELAALKSEAATLMSAQSEMKGPAPADLEKTRAFIEHLSSLGISDGLRPAHGNTPETKARLEAGLADFIKRVAMLAEEAGGLKPALAGPALPAAAELTRISRLIEGVVAMPTGPPEQKNTHTADLETIRILEADGAAIVAEATVLATVLATALAQKPGLAEDDKLKIRNLATRLIAHLGKVDAEHDAHGAKASTGNYNENGGAQGNAVRGSYRPIARPANGTRTPARNGTAKSVAKEVRPTAASAESQALIAKATALGNKLAQPGAPAPEVLRDCRAFLADVIEYASDFTREKQAHTSALKALESLETAITALKAEARGLPAILAPAGIGPADARKISDLLARLVTWQSRLSKQKTAHTGAQKTLREAEALLNSLKSRYAVIQVALKKQEKTHAQDDAITAALDSDFPVLAARLPGLKALHTAALAPMPAMQVESDTLKTRLESLPKPPTPKAPR